LRVVLAFASRKYIKLLPFDKANVHDLWLPLFYVYLHGFVTYYYCNCQPTLGIGYGNNFASYRQSLPSIRWKLKIYKANAHFVIPQAAWVNSYFSSA